MLTIRLYIYIYIMAYSLSPYCIRFHRVGGKTMWQQAATQDVIYRYLDCGDLHNGFARVKCKDCGHEYLLAFSCKRRHFCPSCHQKRVIEFGECLVGSRMILCQVANVGGVSLDDDSQFDSKWADACYSYPYRGLNGDPLGGGHDTD